MHHVPYSPAPYSPAADTRRAPRATLRKAHALPDRGSLAGSRDLPYDLDQYAHTAGQTPVVLGRCSTGMARRSLLLGQGPHSTEEKCSPPRSRAWERIRAGLG